MEPVLTIAAGLSVQSPFVRITGSLVALIGVRGNLTRYLGEEDNVLKARSELMSDHGDPFALLNIFDAWIHTKTQTKVCSVA